MIPSRRRVAQGLKSRASRVTRPGAACGSGLRRRWHRWLKRCGRGCLLLCFLLLCRRRQLLCLLWLFWPPRLLRWVLLLLLLLPRLLPCLMLLLLHMPWLLLLLGCLWFLLWLTLPLPLLLLLSVPLLLLLRLGLLLLLHLRPWPRLCNLLLKLPRGHRQRCRHRWLCRNAKRVKHLRTRRLHGAKRRPLHQRTARGRDRCHRGRRDGSRGGSGRRGCRCRRSSVGAEGQGRLRGCGSWRWPKGRRGRCVGRRRPEGTLLLGRRHLLLLLLLRRCKGGGRPHRLRRRGEAAGWPIP